MKQIIPISIAILAGGKSRRMGTDKAFLLLNDKPLIQHVADKLDGLGTEYFLIAPPSEKLSAILPWPTYPDLIPNSGSLGGIYTALYHAQHPYLLVVACDMPWINPHLIDYQINSAPESTAVVPRWEGMAQSLHAIYHKSLLPMMATQIEQQELKIRTLFSLPTTRWLSEDEIKRFDPLGRSFTNLNTPDQFSEAINEF